MMNSLEYSEHYTMLLDSSINLEKNSQVLNLLEKFRNV